jgi:hypothetical protein
MEKLFIATPTYGYQAYIDYMNGVINFISSEAPKDLKYTTTVHLHSGSALVTHARNNCVAEFLKTDHTKLLFIDSDIGFEPENIWRLLRKNEDVVLAPYVLKNFSGVEKKDFILHYENPENIKVQADGFAEINAGPAGFMMIDRSVFEKLHEAYPEKKVVMRHVIQGKVTEDPEYYTYFDCINEKGQAGSGEDISFCKIWKDIGGKIFCDTEAKLTHCGTRQFSGSLIESLVEKN